MITEAYFNSEKDLAKRIYIYYTDVLLSRLTVGSDAYIKWHKESCVLYYLLKGLFSMKLEDDILTLGSKTITEDELYQYMSTIREYINYDIRELQYIDLDVLGNVKDSAIIPSPPIIISYSITNASWKYYVIDITVDDITEVALPFDYGEADPNSLNINVNDGDPIFITSPSEEGFKWNYIK